MPELPFRRSLYRLTVSSLEVAVRELQSQGKPRRSRNAFVFLRPYN